MRRLLLTSMVVIGATACQVAAQGVVTIHTGHAVRSPAYISGTVLVQQIGRSVPALAISNPRRWGLRSPVGRHGDRGFGDWGYASDPYFYPDDYAEADWVRPSITVIATAIQQSDAPPQPSPAPPRSEMHEYEWPPADSAARPTTYLIVCKDGRVQVATAVWVQGDTLWFYTPDHSTGRLPLDFVDNRTTRQRNGEQQLHWLPSDNQTDSYLIAGG